MEITTILPEVLKQSVLAGVLLFILFVGWNYFKSREEKKDEQMQKKDDMIMALVTDHSIKLLAVQEKTIESNNLLAGAIGQLSDSIDDNQRLIMRDLDQIKKKVAGLPLNTRTVANAAKA